MLVGAINKIVKSLRLSNGLYGFEFLLFSELLNKVAIL